MEWDLNEVNCKNFLECINCVIEYLVIVYKDGSSEWYD